MSPAVPAGAGSAAAYLVEAKAAARQAGVITLWSDTRFEAAHAFYGARGFRRTGRRHLDDASLSVEYRFRKDLQTGPVFESSSNPLGISEAFSLTRGIAL